MLQIYTPHRPSPIVVIPLLLVLVLLVLGGLSACRGNRDNQEADTVFASDTTLETSISSANRIEPTITDLWDGRAHFIAVAAETGLPMGESDTVVMGDTLYAYLHASHQSAGVIDQCGSPVAFPGCVVLLQSDNLDTPFRIRQSSGISSDAAPSCLLPCASCPCQSKRDQIDQQQYPRVVRQQAPDGDRWWMVYEYRATIFLRRSSNGVVWSLPEEVPLTGIWQKWLMGCRPWEEIGSHPFATHNYDCLTGSPPGLFIDGETLYLFVGMGQNPGHMGCFYGPAEGSAALMRACKNNPLFTGADTYGPEDRVDATTNPYFDFRTVSSADVVRIYEQGFGDRYYMLYEGVRGPGKGDAGDTQFALGMARSLTNRIDGAWERFGGNPILVDQPGNVGVGHADWLVVEGETVLFTSLDGKTRSRFELRWKN